ncbi:MAG: hypothetical protein D6741_08785, partial [Planctomycetota bacterium]
MLFASILSTSRASGQIRGEAYLGEPFGVAKIDFPADARFVPAGLGVEGVLVDEQNQRVLYPVVSGPPLGGFFADLVGVAPPGTVYFLFRGQAPLQVTLIGRQPVPVVVQPRSDARGYMRLLNDWWNKYAGEKSQSDYPPFVDVYLKSMLAYRFGLEPPAAKDDSWEEWFRSKLGLALSSEPLRLAMIRDRFFRGAYYKQTADQPLPDPWDASAPVTIPDVENVEVEPIAEHVPQECFYIRFGSFENFLWLQDTMARWGGDFQNLVALRSLNYGIKGKIEQQLVVKQSALARMFGGAIVADVAMIGRDLYFQEGPSFGLLFQVNNGPLFLSDLLNRRAERVKRGEAVEETIQIAGHDVSYLHSPDGRIRSYLASDGNFYLVTTSRAIVERFYEAGAGKGALAGLSEFRHARKLFPVDRDDTAFVYLSRPFLQALTGPAYRIETERR